MRQGDEVLAVGGRCSHYGAPLEDGPVVDETVRRPWHHACFSLRTGEALGPPALNALDCYSVERTANQVRVTGNRAPAPARLFSAVPFFWSTHFDVTIAYVGHAETWDHIVVDGEPQAYDCRVEYWQGKHRRAVATVNRDRASLQVEAEMQARTQLG